MPDKKEKLLIWGASPLSTQLLYPEGPTAYSVRKYIRGRIKKKSNCFEPFYSEEGPFCGHLEENPGFYELYHLEDTPVIIAIIPMRISMGVNSWETSYLVDTIKENSNSLVILLVPDALEDYLNAAILHGSHDLKNYLPKEQPNFGPCTSFFAREWFKAIRGPTLGTIERVEYPTNKNWMDPAHRSSRLAIMSKIYELVEEWAYRPR